MEWVDLGLKRSDEYRKSQATFAVDRFSRGLFGFGIESRWHVHCGWLPLFAFEKGALFAVVKGAINGRKCWTKGRLVSKGNHDSSLV